MLGGIARYHYMKISKYIKLFEDLKARGIDIKPPILLEGKGYVYILDIKDIKDLTEEEFKLLSSGE